MTRFLASAGVLLLLAAFVGMAAPPPNRCVQGYILDISDGGFRFEKEIFVAADPSVTLRRKGGPYAGGLLVGLKVEACGSLDPKAQALQAERIEVLADLNREAEGTALIEARSEDPAGVLLEADGRRLRLNDRTRVLPRRQKNLEPVAGVQALSPGVFVEYRGRTDERGLVQVTEIRAWSNLLEDREKLLYEKYQPEILLPPAGSGPALLQVGPNRYEVFDDGELQLYVDRLGSRLLPAGWAEAESAAERGVRFWFQAVAHETPQASAFPGGAVVLHTGLLRLAENEAQLAFALAHEIAHVTQEHAWRQFLYHRHKLLAVRWGTGGMGYVVESAIRRGYQRDLEEQADRLALGYMVRAGYDPREALAFLRRVEETQRRLPAWAWGTHRSTGDRREAMLEELAAHSARGLAYGALVKDSLEFARLKSKIPSGRIDAVRETEREQ